MKFVNNYIQSITLDAGGATLALTLPDGDYRLTIADDAVSPTRWEIVDAVVEDGTATLTRGQEGTSAQGWAAGSVIYCAVTAETLERIEQTAGQPGQPGEPGEPGEPGPAGPSVELRAGSTHIQWRVEGAAEWQDLIALASLTPSVESVVDAVVDQIGARLLPAGGTQGQLLAKASGADFDTAWTGGVTPPAPERVLSSFYDSVADKTRWVVFDIDANTQDEVNIDAFGYPVVGIFGQIGYSRESKLLVASPSGGGYAVVFDVTDFSVVATSADISQSSGGASISRDGLYAAVQYHNGAGIWDIEENDIAYHSSTPKGLIGSAFSPDGSTVYVGSLGGVEVIDRATATTTDVLDVVGRLQFIALSADGEWVAGATSTNLVVIDVAMNTVVVDLGAFNAGYESRDPLVFHPSDRNILVACRSDYDSPATGAAMVFLIDDPTNPITLNPGLDAEVNAWGGTRASFNADGSRLYLGCETGLFVYDTSDWSYLGSLGDTTWQNVEPVAL